MIGGETLRVTKPGLFLDTNFNHVHSEKGYVH